MCYNLTKYPTVAQLFQIFFKNPLSEDSWNITDSPTMPPNVTASKKQMKMVLSALSELSILASQTAKLVAADKRISPKAKGVSQELCKKPQSVRTHILTFRLGQKITAETVFMMQVK